MDIHVCEPYGYDLKFWKAVLKGLSYLNVHLIDGEEYTISALENYFAEQKINIEPKKIWDILLEKNSPNFSYVWCCTLIGSVIVIINRDELCSLYDKKEEEKVEPDIQDVEPEVDPVEQEIEQLD